MSSFAPRALAFACALLGYLAAVPCVHAQQSALLDLQGLTVNTSLSGQSGWVSLFTGTGDTVKAAVTVPELGSVQIAEGPGAQFVRESSLASALGANDRVTYELLVRYANGSPLHLAPFAQGGVAAGSSAGTYVGPQLSVGYLTAANQARLRAGANATTSDVTVTLPSTINAGDWVWFRLELDLSTLAGSGSATARASYRNLTDGERRYTTLTGLSAVALPVAAMATPARDPATWRGIWLRHDLAFGSTSAWASARILQNPAEAELLWSGPLAPGVGLESSFTSVTADHDRAYVVQIQPDLSVAVRAINRDGVELSSSTILPAGSVTSDPHYGFSIGLDPRGRLHVAGGSHNEGWRYWVSTAPRSAAAFTDRSSPTGVNFGASPLGGKLITYANFFRDTVGDLWVTARVQATSVASSSNGLSGLRGGWLARYNPDSHGGVWEAVGAQAPITGNTWPTPVLTWDDTGRAASVSDNAEWYQAYRLNFDFDAANDLHAAWIAFGSLAEGVPYTDARTTSDGAGATHANYLRLDRSANDFVTASGAALPLPATRWDGNISYVNPGKLHFAAFVAAPDSGGPLVSYWQNNQNVFRRWTGSAWTTAAALPLTQHDVTRQIFARSDGSLAFTDQRALLRSTDLGATWTAQALPFTVLHLDKYFSRRSGRILAASRDGNDRHQLWLVETTPGAANRAPLAIADAYPVSHNTALAAPAPGVLANDLDAELAGLSASLVTGPASGTLSLSADGSFTYTPATGFSGTVSFTYRATDASGATADTTATLTVAAASAPLAAEERLDLATGTLGTGAGSASFGFADTWSAAFLSATGSPLAVSSGTLPLTIAGSDSGLGNHLGTTADNTLRNAVRELAPAEEFSLAADDTRYLSFIVRVRSTPSTGELQAVRLLNRFGETVGGFRRYANNRITIGLGAAQVNSIDAGQSGHTFNTLSSTPEQRLVVLKLVARAASADTLYVRTYVEGETPVEPTATGPGAASWSAFATADLSDVVAGLQVMLKDSGLAFDELRLGRTFAAVTGPRPVTGSIRRELWSNVSGTAVTSIPVSTTPTSVTNLTTFETTTNFANSYGQRLRGRLHPATSGNYSFWVAGDDQVELWLSTDATPANKVRIAYHTSYTTPRQWNKFTTQRSAPIALVAGQSYYIEALHKEGGSSDNFAVAWRLNNTTHPTNGSATDIIPGSSLSPFSP